MPKRLRDEKKDHYWEDELGKCTSIIKVRVMMIMMVMMTMIILITGWECIVKLELGKEEELDDGQCPS